MSDVIHEEEVEQSSPTLLTHENTDMFTFLAASDSKGNKKDPGKANAENDLTSVSPLINCEDNNNSRKLCKN